MNSIIVSHVNLQLFFSSCATATYACQRDVVFMWFVVCHQKLEKIIRLQLNVYLLFICVVSLSQLSCFLFASPVVHHLMFSIFFWFSLSVSFSLSLSFSYTSLVLRSNCFSGCAWWSCRLIAFCFSRIVSCLDSFLSDLRDLMTSLSNWWHVWSCVRFARFFDKSNDAFLRCSVDVSCEVLSNSRNCNLSVCPSSSYFSLHLNLHIYFHVFSSSPLPSLFVSSVFSLTLSLCVSVSLSLLSSFSSVSSSTLWLNKWDRNVSCWIIFWLMDYGFFGDLISTWIDFLAFRFSWMSGLCEFYRRVMIRSYGG